MLTLHLDSSLLNSAKPEEVFKPELTLMLNGLNWEKGKKLPDGWETPTDDEVKNIIKKTLYPWRWNQPEEILIVWLDKNNKLLTEEDGVTPKPTIIKLTKPTLKDYKDDIISLKKHIELTLNKELGLDINKIRKNQIIWATKSTVEEIEINDTYEINKDSEIIGNETGFLKAAIGQYAQNIPPLNQGLNLAFFANDEKVTVPPLAISFVAFLVGGESWDNYDLNQIKTDENFVTLNYKPTTLGSITELQVYSSITPITSKATANTSVIKLRDDDGNFEGTVKIDAKDEEDWTNGIQKRIGAYFDLPKLFYEYLKDNAESLKFDKSMAHKIQEHITWLKKIDEYFWAVSRDTLGFGFQNGGDDSSIVHHLVLEFSNNEIGNLHSLNEETKIQEYWNKYKEIKESIEPKVKKLDKTHYDTAEKWRNLFVEKFLDDKEANAQFKKVIEGCCLLSNMHVDKITISELNETIKRWLEAWENMIDLFDDTTFQKEMVLVQWNKVKFSELDVKYESILMKYLEKVLENINDLRGYFKESLVKIKEIKLPDNEILKSTRENIIKYSENRIKTNSDKYPQIVDPFKLDINGLSFMKFNEKIEEVLMEQMEKTDAEIEIIKKDTYEVVRRRLFPHKSFLKPGTEKTFLNPPAVRLKVDTVTTNTQTGNTNDADDINNEIAGHIILIRRCDQPGLEPTNEKWNYLNKVTEPKFKNHFIIPASVPEVNEAKKPYLEISNEKLSIIAGDANQFQEDKENLKEYLRYAENENEQKEFWYGHKYNFAGFVAHNSGVLPKYLRKPEENWNVPNLDFKSIIEKAPIQISEVYLHLRRVPVSKVRVSPKEKIKPLPQGLLPLAFELPEWKRLVPEQGKKTISEEDDKKDHEQVHYLLAKGDNFRQESITLELRKPATPFWNWYAWMGKELEKELIHKSNSGDITKKLRIWAKEIDNRNRRIKNKEGEEEKDKIKYFCDPAVEDGIVIKVKRVFPTIDDILVEPLSFAYKPSPELSGEEWKHLADVSEKLVIKVGVSRGVNKNEITIAEGDIIQVFIHTKIKKEHFEKSSNAKFHNWMKNHYEFDGAHYLSPPTEVWFEAAKELSTKSKDEILIKKYLSARNLWDSIKINQIGDKVNCSLIKTEDNYDKLAYASRIEVKHQIWNWNGRLDSSDILLKDIKNLNPVLPPPPATEPKPTTTEAMKWEAWAFSDRPDFSALVQDANLLASRKDVVGQPLPHKQILFSDLRPNEEKALYYRFTAVAHSRYEKLGAPYNIPIEAKVGVQDVGIPQPVDNIWKRYLRKSSKTKQLPKPSIRFVIPLTRSIQECNEKEINEENKISAASLLIVLNDRWFTEAGLAEQLEVGIDVVKDPVENQAERGGEYLQAGHDPILDRKGLSHLNANPNMDREKYPYIEENGESKVAVFKPKGPAGLTFEPKMQTPLVRGSSFILNIPDVSKLLHNSDKMQAWAMMQISVRRTLREEFCEKDISIEALKSGWTAKEWVQFLPAVDSFIPKAWREQVRKQNVLHIKFTADNISTIDAGNKMPLFDSTYEDRIQRYLVLTETVYDIGGQPCESYKATLMCRRDTDGSFNFELNHPKKADIDLTKLNNGFLRMIIVRVDVHKNDNETENTDIWSRLFGENALVKADMNLIQNDPTAALPLVSERIPFKNQ
jgi:hypothetical protein